MYRFSLSLFNFLLTLCLTLQLTPSVFANPLDEVLESRKMKIIENDTRRFDGHIRTGAEKRTPWFDKRSAYGRIFLEDEERRRITGWLFANIRDLKVQRDVHALRDTHIVAKIQGRTDSKKYYSLEAWIPHPAFFALLDVNLLPPFAALYPTVEEEELSDTYTIQGKTARLFQKKNHECSMLIPSARRSIIRLVTEKCERFGEMIKLAEQIDFERFESKLGESQVPAQETPTPKAQDSAKDK